MRKEGGRRKHIVHKLYSITIKRNSMCDLSLVYYYLYYFRQIQQSWENIYYSNNKDDNY